MTERRGAFHNSPGPSDPSTSLRTCLKRGRKDGLAMTREGTALLKNTGKTRYNWLIKNYKLLIELERRGNARGYFISR